MIPSEFVFTPGNKKLYGIEDLDYFDDILREENIRFWGNVKNGIVKVFQQVQNKYDEEPRIVYLGKMPVEDAQRKFG